MRFDLGWFRFLNSIDKLVFGFVGFEMHFGYLGFYGRVPKNSGGSKWGDDNIKGSKLDRHPCAYSDGASIKSLSLTNCFFSLSYTPIAQISDKRWSWLTAPLYRSLLFIQNSSVLVFYANHSITDRTVPVCDSTGPTVRF